MPEKKSGNRLSQEKRAEIVRRLKVGEGATHIARECKVGRSTVVRIQLSDVPKDTTTYGALLQCRVSLEEKETFQALAKSVNKSESYVLRSIIRAASGFMEIDGSTIVALEEIKRALSSQGGELNQIVRSAKKGQVNWTGKERDQVLELLSGYRNLAGYIEAAVNASTRKSSTFVKDVML